MICKDVYRQIKEIRVSNELNGDESYNKVSIDEFDNPAGRHRVMTIDYGIEHDLTLEKDEVIRLIAVLQEALPYMDIPTSDYIPQCDPEIERFHFKCRK